MSALTLLLVMHSHSSSSSDLEACARELVEVAKGISDMKCTGDSSDLTCPGAANTAQLNALTESQAKQRVTAIIDRLQNLIADPAEFVQRLAHNVSYKALLDLEANETKSDRPNFWAACSGCAIFRCLPASL